MSQGYTADNVIDHLRALKLTYIQNGVGSDPAALPNHFAEFLGYATFLYDHYAEYLKKYAVMETQVIKAENARRDELNATKKAKEKLIPMAEVDKRIDIQLGDAKAERKRLEVAVKGATLHINGCQSLMKNWGDEAKGIR